MTSAFFMAVAFVLILEGLAYGLAPRPMKGLMRQLADTPDDRLQVIGLAACGGGVLMLWLMRVMF
jgi:uncharacterized protein YjeT (DUF2065 family)